MEDEQLAHIAALAQSLVKDTMGREYPDNMDDICIAFGIALKSLATMNMRTGQPLTPAHQAHTLMLHAHGFRQDVYVKEVGSTEEQRMVVHRVPNPDKPH